jgi:hypothetical protein
MVNEHAALAALSPTGPTGFCAKIASAVKETARMLGLVIPPGVRAIADEDRRKSRSALLAVGADFEHKDEPNHHSEPYTLE